MSPADVVRAVARHGRRDRRRREDATATLELVVLAPAVFLVMSLMFAFARVAQAESLVDQAARDGARAATAQNSRSQAPVVAERTAREALVKAPTSCVSSQEVGYFPSARAFLLPDLANPDAVEHVQVTVSCRIDLADLTLIPLHNVPVPIRRDFVSPLDRYRGYVR